MDRIEDRRIVLLEKVLLEGWENLWVEISSKYSQLTNANG